MCQLLAAAAPLAGGALERAWDPEGAPQLLRGLEEACDTSEWPSDAEDGPMCASVQEGHRPDEEPAAKRACLDHGPHCGSDSETACDPPGVAPPGFWHACDSLVSAIVRS